MRISILVVTCLLAASTVEAASLLTFKSNKCGPCRQMEPTLKNLERKGYVVIRIDVDTTKGRKLAKKYDVTELPTFIVLDKSGKVKARETGVVSEAILIAALRVVKWLIIKLL